MSSWLWSLAELLKARLKTGHGLERPKECPQVLGLGASTALLLTRTCWDLRRPLTSLHVCFFGDYQHVHDGSWHLSARGLDETLQMTVLGVRLDPSCASVPVRLGEEDNLHPELSAGPCAQPEQPPEHKATPQFLWEGRLDKHPPGKEVPSLGSDNSSPHKCMRKSENGCPVPQLGLRWVCWCPAVHGTCQHGQAQAQENLPHLEFGEDD
ncbi:hypothetical protein TREES_T100013860 [Tupaia chinensis]|uniref:Uncharacterized protein n=1 Tax=Tupaia chinensis TaxID=246437 RepID=L9L026_TUPCH|nr:hypothetical protein TREES_T100013860 [Tupaia chinensis]